MSTLLQELNDFSLQIAQAIELNDWEKLSEILIQRQSHLEALLNAPSSEKNGITKRFQVGSARAKSSKRLLRYRNKLNCRFNFSFIFCIFNWCNRW